MGRWFKLCTSLSMAILSNSLFDSNLRLPDACVWANVKRYSKINMHFVSYKLNRNSENFVNTCMCYGYWTVNLVTVTLAHTSLWYLYWITIMIFYDIAASPFRWILRLSATVFGAFQQIYFVCWTFWSR